MRFYISQTLPSLARRAYARIVRGFYLAMLAPTPLLVVQARRVSSEANAHYELDAKVMKGIAIERQAFALAYAFRAVARHYGVSDAYLMEHFRKAHHGDQLYLAETGIEGF